MLFWALLPCFRVPFQAVLETPASWAGPVFVVSAPGMLRARIGEA